ncbi:MAG TPA: response regulator, partial [Candidatus Limnocylindria bacterium]|nr:response regulator [Candidatus Limnocylindria bacterium]
MTSVRVAVVDDHPVVRTGTAAIIDGADGLVLAGTAATLDEARPLLDREAVDVLLLDLRLGQEFGLDALVGDGKTLPAVVVVTSY